MIDFPASPTVGQQFTAAGVTWTWDGVKWLPSGLSPLVMPGIGDNRIVNGDFRIDQRNNGASGTASGYTVDRWLYFGSAAAKGTWQRNGPVNYILGGFPYWLGFTSSSAYTPAAGEIFQLAQQIEADMVSDFQWGTSNAQPVTLSFWVSSTLTGTFSGAILNYAATRSYPFSYSISTASVWTKITITILGDTAGTWVMAGNAGSMTVSFDLGSGATYRAPANAWRAGAFYGANGAVNAVGTNGAIFGVTGVKLEVGSVATAYNRQSLAKSLADCQRYYQIINGVVSGGYGTAGMLLYFTVTCSSMRASPTMTLTGQSNVNCSTTVVYSANPQAAAYTMTVTAAGSATTTFNLGLAAEL